MCQACVDAVAKWFPKVKKKDYHDLLMNATCFPMGSAKTIERQLRQMAKKGITTVAAASAYTCNELFKASVKIDRTTKDST